MSQFEITADVTAKVSLYEFDTQLIVKFLEMKDYLVIKNEDVHDVLEDENSERLINALENYTDFLYHEKENIRIFFAQDKFKAIPNKDLVEFLNKYR